MQRTISQPTERGATGLALLAHVKHAYLRVPAVTVSGREGPSSVRFTLVLRLGVAVAEEFDSTDQTGGGSLLVAHGRTAFVWDNSGEDGAGCWGPLGGLFNRTLGDIGLPFPDQTPMRVGAPRRTRSGWALPVLVGAGDSGTVAIDAKSFLVRSITLNSQSGAVLERVTTLDSTPELTNPEPRC